MRTLTALALTIVLPGVAPSLTAQDTIRVRSDGPPRWGSTVTLVQAMKIGQADGPPEYAFGNIYRAAAEPGGAFYLYDANDRQIRRYDAMGRFTGLIGRNGGGPGEYQHVGGMAVDRSGMLVVFDPGNRRLTTFRPDGSMERETRVTRSAFDPMVMDTAGRRYIISSVGGGLMEGAGARQQFLLLAQGGEVVDSLRFPRLVEPTAVRRGFALSTTDGVRMNFIAENFVAAYLTGGLVAASSTQYKVVVDNGRGRVMTIERKHDPVPLAAQERAQWLETADSMALRGGGPYEIPRVKPPIRGLFTDATGRIWVHLYAAAEDRHEDAIMASGRRRTLFWKERNTFDVFNAQGAYLGRVVLPPETIVLTVEGNRLYARGKGPDGEDTVVVFRLPAAGA